MATPIATLIINSALCRDCIAHEAGVDPAAVEAVIQRLIQSVKIDLYANGLCLECGSEALVYAIDCPPCR